jgi:hypothetical protein
MRKLENVNVIRVITKTVSGLLFFVAAVAQQCIEEGVNLKVWVETRVYFKILS